MAGCSWCDSATAGMVLGFAGHRGPRRRGHRCRHGAGPHGGRLDAAARTSTLFYVDTLEFLRRGGRISAASALLGTALSVKPILHVSGGQVVLKEKVRTAARALGRLTELAVAAAESSNVDIAVQHLGAAGRAEDLRASLVERLGERLRHVCVMEVGAVVAAHTGPGVIGATVHRRVDA